MGAARAGPDRTPGPAPGPWWVATVVGAAFGFVMVGIALLCLFILKLSPEDAAFVVGVWFLGSEFMQRLYDRYKRSRV